MNATLQKPAAPDHAAPAKTEELPPLSAMPSAEDYAAAARRRAWSFLLGGMILAAAVAGSFVVMGLDNIFLPLSLLICVLTPILFWRFPRLALYATLAGVCRNSGGDISLVVQADSLTDREFRFFWNVNTIFSTYAHLSYVKAVPLNLFELSSPHRPGFVPTDALRFYRHRQAAGRFALLLPMLDLCRFCSVLAWIHGLATGGDFKISLAGSARAILLCHCRLSHGGQS